MRGVPRTQLDRSDLLASGAVVCAANLVALAEALFDLNARDPRHRHLVLGLVELGLEAEAAQDVWCTPVPLGIEGGDPAPDRKSVAMGKSVTVREVLGGRR